MMCPEVSDFKSQLRTKFIVHCFTFLVKNYEYKGRILTIKLEC